MSSIRRKSITPSVLEGRDDRFLETRGAGGQIKHVFEIPLGTGAGKTKLDFVTEFPLNSLHGE